MEPYNFLQRWFLRVSCIYGLLLVLALFDSGSYSIPDPVTTPPKPATVTEAKELDAKEKIKEKDKASAPSDFKSKNMLEADRKKDEASKAEAPNLQWYERLVKRTPHYLKWWNLEFVPYELYVVFMFGCGMSVIWIIQWMLKKFKGDRD